MTMRVTDIAHFLFLTEHVCKFRNIGMWVWRWWYVNVGMKSTLMLIEHFHHVITIPYTRNKPPSWCTTCTVCYYYAILIKKPIGSVAMLFWPIQHILETLQAYHSFCEDLHRSFYLVLHQYGSCFPFSFAISKIMTYENALLKLSTLMCLWITFLDQMKNMYCTWEWGCGLG